MNNEEKKKASWGRVVFSTIAAFVGVQSEKNRAHDFQQSSILPFLIVGLILAGAFIVGLVFIARHLAP
jgi:uncharacterized membrane protein YidH (DUF202 family)